MSAKALFAASRGLEFAVGMNNAYQEQAFAELQSSMMRRQMEEIDARTNIAIEEIHQQAEKVTANQQIAFISGGVELSGSAMSVISDTINDAARAAYMRRREADYDLTNLRVEKGRMDAAASDTDLYLKIASAGIGSAAGFAKDSYALNKGGGKKKAQGFEMPEATSAVNYQPGAAKGIA